MNKRKFTFPSVILTATTEPPDVTIIGGGSGEGGSDAVPCDFGTWLNSTWAADLVGEGGVIDADDFAAWWEANGFSQEDWEYFNPDLPWDDYFE